MDMLLLKDMINVIRTEERRKQSEIQKEDDPDGAYDQWTFVDRAFINELYLMLLVTVRHQLEKELVRLAARSGDQGRELSRAEYEVRVQQLKRSWNKVEQRLYLNEFQEYKTLEVLRLLSNAY